MEGPIELVQVEAFDADDNLIEPAEGASAEGLRITYGSEKAIAKLVVTNRVDCCRGRIIGAQISITAGSNGDDVLWSSTFRGEEASYTFDTRTSLVPSSHTWFRSVARLAACSCAFMCVRVLACS